MPTTVNCEQCGTPVTRPQSQMKSRVFCSKACAYAGLKKANPTARRNLYLPDHPLAGTKGYVSEHRAVLFEKIGPGEHPCHWCGTLVHWTVRLKGTGHKGMLVADHVNTNELDNRPENLVPACQGCNITRRHHIKPDEIHIVRNDGQRRRAVTLTCEKCGGTYIREPRGNRPNRFCSRACYYAAKKRK